MGWQSYLWLLAAIVCGVLGFLMLRNYEVVRDKYPWTGWAAYLMLIVLAFECYARSGMPT